MGCEAYARSLLVRDPLPVFATRYIHTNNEASLPSDIMHLQAYPSLLFLFPPFVNHLVRPVVSLWTNSGRSPHSFSLSLSLPPGAHASSHHSILSFLPLPPTRHLEPSRPPCEPRLSPTPSPPPSHRLLPLALALTRDVPLPCLRRDFASGPRFLPLGRSCKSRVGPAY